MQKFFILFLILFYSTAVFSQQLEATEEEFLVFVSVKDFDDKAIEGAKIFFDGDKTKKSFHGITNAQGTFQILLPKGETYSIRYKDFSKVVDYNKIELPSQQGIYEVEVFIKYKPSRVIVLENVLFDTGKATLKASSYPALNDIVEILTMKPKMIIEIGGHTDNVGTKESNQKLSQARAESVRNYLISKGIKANRITAVGYGQEKPVADNSTAEGRQKNRRTEVTILSE
jgi:outer membrane protein OmpA-like peptidoglycan-associated protein